MGRLKKGFNAAARQGQRPGHFTDQSEVDRLRKKVQLGADQDDVNADEGSNVLALPGDRKKRAFKADQDGLKKRALLSKKKRKQLEKLVEAKKKKAERGQLIEQLKEVRVKEGQLSRMTSLAAVQTRGIKRTRDDEEEDQMGEGENRVGVHDDDDDDGKKRRRRRRRRKKEEGEDEEDPTESPGEKRDDVLGFEQSSSEDEDEIEEEEEEEKAEAPEEKEEGKTEASEGKEVEEQQKKEDGKDGTPAQEGTSKAGKSGPPGPAPLVLSRPDGTLFVPVSRPPAIEALREKLPIVSEEQVIMEAVNRSPVVILAGETGSGKTTQVPQFLYEAGYASGRRGQIIGVTEPRRVAAMAMAKRVGEELNQPSLSSYQIRFEGNVTEETRIKFMTDGVLLREMAKDFRLSKYSVLVIDEAHERSVFTDILIGYLSRIVPLRAKDEKNGPLRLVVMSATLRVEDFTENARLFKNVPPVIKVESRQFETTCHFQRETPDDYLLAALKKTCKIHRDLPEGGILVFVTGQQEVNQLVRKLRRMFPAKKKLAENGKGKEDEDDEEEEESMERSMKRLKKATGRGSKKGREGRSAAAPSPGQVVARVNLDNYRVLPLPDDADGDGDVQQEDADGEDDADADAGAAWNAFASSPGQPLWVLPLYSLLSSAKQAKIFDPVPAAHRLCVVATNIAETSLTIPGIKYVVDTGKVKTKFYDKLTGVSTYQVTWTSKASADQRAGRAGRQSNGHCYRLYSSEVFKSSFAAHAQPEMVKRPAEDLTLQMKAMRINNVVNFPFPTPPDPVQLKVAERRLINLGALEDVPTKTKAKTKNPAVITELGKSMSAFPLAPSFAKMLALSEQHNLMPYTIVLVSALTVQEVLLETPVGGHGDVAAAMLNPESLSGIRRKWSGSGQTYLLGDPQLLMSAVCAAEWDAWSAKGSGNLHAFCQTYALRHKAMLEIRKLRRQLTNEVNLVLPRLNLEFKPNLEPPTQAQAALLRQIVLAGMINNVARKVDVEAEVADVKERPKWRLAYRCGDLQEPVFLHGKSVFAMRKSSSSSSSSLPDWLVYQDVYETGGKMFLRGATAVEPEWLARLAGPLCHFLPPRSEPEPWYAADTGRVTCRLAGTFGPQAWPLPAMDRPYPRLKADDAAAGVKYFGRFLLEGRVCPGLEQFRDVLLCRPATLTKSAHFHSAEVKAFLGRLAAAGNVDSLDRLKRASEKDADFLKAEFAGLIPQAKSKKLDDVWPLFRE